MKLIKTLPIYLLLILCGQSLHAQISPGELCKAHAGLEGVSNCTKCHEVGNKVTRKKCLDCHKEINAKIVAKKGYHASSEVNGKECVVCHNDHHGRGFQIIRFNKTNFKHNLTGFSLKGVHAKQECKACHNADRIKNPKLKSKPTTYLGLSSECLSCHDDFHQGKLSSKCTDCHNYDSFKKALGFDHSATNFPLLGRHKKTDCNKCHKTTITNGHKTQNFKGLQFANCTPCHKDVHNNKFGQDCKKCHSEESFSFRKEMKAFDHDKTNFKLLGKHKLVNCVLCHKGSLTAPLKHNNCNDCHTDYHKGDFTKKGQTPDCNQCHTNNGFTPSTYTVEKHNASKFKLEGAHLASSCMACHKKEGNWTFINMGKRCVDCHKNEHKGFIDEKFFPEEDCMNCHNINTWKKPYFDHNRTGYKLEGQHANAACSECHYRKNEQGIAKQLFKGTAQECSSCHKDSHVNQFAINGKTDCTRCHGFDKWENSKYDHNTSRFKIDGHHTRVKCEQCHKEVMNEKGKYIEYKFDNVSCARCHTI